jgi:hypothetical protein
VKIFVHFDTEQARDTEFSNILELRSDTALVKGTLPLPLDKYDGDIVNECELQ